MNKFNLFGSFVAGAVATAGICGSAHAGTESVLVHFADQANGATPMAGLINVSGTLYGTTSRGGAFGQGTVFSSTTKGVQTVLYSFGGASGDGTQPFAGLVSLNGNLYGTTTQGGAHGYGAVFELKPAVSGGQWTESVIYSFKGADDGATPWGGLFTTGGKLYGTTTGGKVNGQGSSTVFKLAPPATAGAQWMETVLHKFASDGSEGAFPTGTLIDVGGKLYGTTYHGGLGRDPNGCNDSAGTGCGTAFEVTLPTKTAPAVLTVIHQFSPSDGDGTEPFAGLTNVGGTLYGTSIYGGVQLSCESDVVSCGTVFKLMPPAPGYTTWGEQVVYTFTGGANDGAYPWGALVNVQGTLYGTTGFGGSGIAGTDCWKDASNIGCGTVFKLTPVADSSEWMESLVYSFGSVGSSTDGSSPRAGLVNISGKLYGTTSTGAGTSSNCFNYMYDGAYGCGTVFKVVP